jgi:hypothetical protein
MTPQGPGDCPASLGSQVNFQADGSRAPNQADKAPERYGPCLLTVMDAGRLSPSPAWGEHGADGAQTTRRRVALPRWVFLLRNVRTSKITAWHLLHFEAVMEAGDLRTA